MTQRQLVVKGILRMSSGYRRASVASLVVMPLKKKVIFDDKDYIYEYEKQKEKSESSNGEEPDDADDQTNDKIVAEQ